MNMREKLMHLLSCGYTQTKISKLTGISQSSVSKIISGQQFHVRYENGQKLDDLIGILKNYEANQN